MVSRLAMMIEACETELARYMDLRGLHHQDAGYLVGWLDHEISSIEDRLRWLTTFSDQLD